MFTREVGQVGVCHDSVGYAKIAAEAGLEAEVFGIRQERGTQWLTSGPGRQEGTTGGPIPDGKSTLRHLKGGQNGM